MTDNIIINGVDVSGCVPYKNRSCLVDFCLTDTPFSEAKCEKNPNCYYKQLKRKEQELEMAKQIILQGFEDFSLKYGTPQYDRLLKNAKTLGIEVSDYE